MECTCSCSVCVSVQLLWTVSWNVNLNFVCVCSFMTHFAPVWLKWLSGLYIKNKTHTSYNFSVNRKLFLLWSWFCSGIVRAKVGVCVDAQMQNGWCILGLMYRGDPMSSGLSEWWIVYPVFCTLQPFCLGHCQLDERSNKTKTNISFGGVHFVLFFISVALEGSALSPKQKHVWGWVLPGNNIITCLLPAWNCTVSAQFDMLSHLMLSEPTSHLWYFVISMVFSLPSSDFLSSVLKHWLTGRKTPSYLLTTIIMSAPFTLSTIWDWNPLQGYSRGDNLILLCHTPPTDQSPSFLFLFFKGTWNSATI